MTERLSDLTRSVEQAHARAWPYQAIFAALRNPGNLELAAADAARLFSHAPHISKVLMASVAAGDTTTSGWASQLVPISGLFAEWTSNLTPKTLLGQLPTFTVPFLMPAALIDLNSTNASWVQQGQPIPVSRFSYTTSTALQPKKLAIIVPFTYELTQSWGPSTQRNIEDQLTRVVRRSLDRALLNPDLAVSDAQPASLTNGLAQSQSTGSSGAQVVADLKAALGVVLAGSEDPTRIVIAAPPSTVLHWSQLQSSGGTPLFPFLGVTGGMVWGVRVVVTSAASLLGSPASNLAAVIDGGRVALSDENQVMIDSSRVTSLQLNDAPASGAQNMTSLYQTNAVALRLTLFKNFVRLDNTSVAWFQVAY